MLKKIDTTRELEKIIIQHRPVTCEKCDGKMYYVAGGEYECRACGATALDDFGKVKKYLGEYGPSPAVVISAAIGVKREIINLFLKRGRLEIPEGSKYFLSCERCACAIRYGRFCPECMREITGGLSAAFNEDVGERPKNPPKMNGKYRFLEKK